MQTKFFKMLSGVMLATAILLPGFASAESESFSDRPFTYELFSPEASVKKASSEGGTGLVVPKPAFAGNGNRLNDGTQGGIQISGGGNLIDIIASGGEAGYESNVADQEKDYIGRYLDPDYRVQNGDILVRMLMLPLLDDQNLNITAKSQASLIMPIIKLFVELLFGLVAFIIFFNVIAGAVKTATSGEFLGGDFKLSSQLFRLIFSFVCLMPLGGTVAIIYFVAWLSVQGIYMADMLNDEYQERFELQVETRQFTFPEKLRESLGVDILKIAQRRACVLQLQATKYKSLEKNKNKSDLEILRDLESVVDTNQSRASAKDLTATSHYYFGVKPIQFVNSINKGKADTWASSTDLNSYVKNKGLFEKYYQGLKDSTNAGNVYKYFNMLKDGDSMSEAYEGIKNQDEVAKGYFADIRKINKLPFFYQYGGFLEDGEMKKLNTSYVTDYETACGSAILSYGTASTMLNGTFSAMRSAAKSAETGSKDNSIDARQSDGEESLLKLVEKFVSPALIQNVMTNASSIELIKLKQLMLMNDLLGGSGELAFEKEGSIKTRILKPIGKITKEKGTELFGISSLDSSANIHASNMEMRKYMNMLVANLAFGGNLIEQSGNNRDDQYTNDYLNASLAYRVADAYINQVRGTYSDITRSNGSWKSKEERKKNGFSALGLYYWGSIYNGAELMNSVKELPKIRFTEGDVFERKNTATQKDLEKLQTVGTGGYAVNILDDIEKSLGNLSDRKNGKTYQDGDDLKTALTLAYESSPMNPGNLSKIFAEPNPMVVTVRFGEEIVNWALDTATQMASTKYYDADTIKNGHITKQTSSYNAISIAIIMFCTGLLVMGLTMMIYVPLLPFIIWFGAIVGYIVTFFEALVATPVWAFAHALPEKNGFIGKQSQGYMLLFALLIKPALMVFGFIASIQLLYPIGYLLNMMMLVVLWIILSNASGILWFFTFTVTVFIYFAFLQNVVKKLFGLVHIIPDQVMKYVGNSSVSSLGEYANQIEQGTQQASEKVSQAGVSAASSGSYRMNQDGDSSSKFFKPSSFSNLQNQGGPSTSGASLNIPKFGQGFSNAQRNSPTLGDSESADSTVGGNGAVGGSAAPVNTGSGGTGGTNTPRPKDNTPPIVTNGKLNSAARDEASIQSKGALNTPVEQGNTSPADDTKMIDTSNITCERGDSVMGETEHEGRIPFADGFHTADVTSTDAKPDVDNSQKEVNEDEQQQKEKYEQFKF